MAIRRYWISVDDEHGQIIPPLPIEQTTSHRLVLVATEIALELAGRTDLAALQDLLAAVASVQTTLQRSQGEASEVVRDGR